MYEYRYHSSCFPFFWRLTEHITQGLPKHGIEVKVKLTPEQATKAQRGNRGIALLFLNLGARWGMGGQLHAPAALPPGKTRYPLYRRLGGPQDRSAGLQKISPPPGFDPRTVQPVARSYTDWATPAHANKRSRCKQTVRDMYRSHGHVAEFASLMGCYTVSTGKRDADISKALESWQAVLWVMLNMKTL